MVKVEVQPVGETAIADFDQNNILQIPVDRTSDLVLIKKEVNTLLNVSGVEINPVPNDEVEIPYLNEEQQRLLESNMTIADKQARKYLYKSIFLSFDELRSAALEGLMKAAKSFNPARGISFEIYATTMINGSILHELRDNSPAKNRIAKKNKIIIGTIDEPISKDSPDTILDTYFDNTTEAEYKNVEDRIVLEAAINQISNPKYKEVLRLRFGLKPYTGEDRSQAEVGQEMGCTQTHVWRLLSGALDELKQILSPT